MTDNMIKVKCNGCGNIEVGLQKDLPDRCFCGGVYMYTEKDICKHCREGKVYENFKEPIHMCLDKEGNHVDGICNVTKFGQWIKCSYCIGTGIHTPLSEDPYL